MSRLLDRLAGAYFSQNVVRRGKHTIGGKLRPHLGRIRCRTSSGMLFDADPVDLIQYSVLLTGEWEPAESAVLRDRLGPGSVFYDIGANAGYFTLLAAQQVGATGHVYAVEPNASILGTLRHHIEINELTNVTVLPVALADADRRGAFHVVGGANSGTSSLRPEVSDGPSAAPPTEVDLVRLDSLVRDLGLRPPDVIKMDIEGAEFLALSGMAETLRANDEITLLIEVSDRFLRQIAGSEDELMDLLARAGFERLAEVSRHPRTEPDGRPFQYTALLRRATPGR